jgi:hypothetical protein
MQQFRVDDEKVLIHGAQYLALWLGLRILASPRAAGSSESQSGRSSGFPGPAASQSDSESARDPPAASPGPGRPLTRTRVAILSHPANAVAVHAGWVLVLRRLALVTRGTQMRERHDSFKERVKSVDHDHHESGQGEG